MIKYRRLTISCAHNIYKVYIKIKFKGVQLGLKDVRQSKPKSNTKVFGLGFSFAKIQVLTAFFGCLCAVVLSFSVFVWCVRIALSVAVADGFMPRKVLDVRKECVRLSCQRQTKSPSGLSVGGLFAYRHAPERLTSRTPWNKSSAYVSDTHYKSEIFKSVILSVLYHIRHFDVFVVKRKTLTFVKVYRLWGVVDNYHFVVIQLNFLYEVIYQL